MLLRELFEKKRGILAYSPHRENTTVFPHYFK